MLTIGQLSLYINMMKANIEGKEYQAKQLRYARLLLQEFKKEGSEGEVVDRFVEKYAERLEVPEGFRKKKEEQLMIAQYNHLKQALTVLEKQSRENLKRLQDLNRERYEPIKQIMSKKHSVDLDNFTSRITALTPTNPDEQQLTRISKLLENGLWGCLPRLNDRLSKLSQLRSS